jgi:hypothetical protein
VDAEAHPAILNPFQHFLDVIKMADKPIAEAVQDQLDIQHKMRKRRNYSGPSVELFGEVKKARQTSSDLAKSVEVLEAESDKASNVEAIWKGRLDVVESLMKETGILMRLNDEAFKDGYSTRPAYAEAVHEICRVRKMCVDYQLYLTTKKTDLATFKSEMPWVPKEHHQEMATLLLSSFMQRKLREATKESTIKLEVKGRRGLTISWKSYLAAEYQGSYVPANPSAASSLGEIKFCAQDFIWVPILGRPIHHSGVRAAHIVARCENDAYIRALFGVADHKAFLMDAGNGLFMTKALEAAFNKGEFIIVPTGEVDECGRAKFKCRVLRSANLQQKGGKKTLVWQLLPEHHGDKIYWDDIHDRELRFPPGCTKRPYRRCLFHHAIGAVMLCRQLRLDGWKDAWEDFFSRPIWATPEKYLEQSLLQSTWNLVTGEDVPESLKDFAFPGMGSFATVDCQMWASELMAKMVPENLGDQGEDSEDDNNED